MDNFIYNLSDLNFDDKYSYADYLTWKFYQRTELHNGKLVVLDNTGTLHQTVFGNLIRLFNNFFENENLILCQAPFDVRIHNKSNFVNDEDVFTVLQPDFSVFDDDEKLDEKGGIDAPVFIIEILSPLSNNYNNELIDKFSIYEKAGVQEYWIIAPMQKMILIYILKNGVFVALEPIKENQIFHGVLFPQLQINSNELLIEMNFPL
jgi:Uma2 family endonuclease